MCTNKDGGGGNIKASTSINVSSLPPLEGSPKQIAWAEEIRKNFVEEQNKKMREGDISRFEIKELYYNGAGIVGTRLNSIYDETPYVLKMREIAQKQGISEGEARLEAESYINEVTHKNFIECTEARKKAKSQGKSKEEIKKAEREVRKKLVPMYKQMLEDSLKNGRRAKNAGDWIEAFKNG